MAIRKARRSRRSRTTNARHRLEILEDRLVPAVILWDGGPTGTGTNWNDPVNWAGDALPGATDDAQIGTAFADITITSPSSVTIRA